ncbi:hypothetical protein Nmel_004163 [Mimus melanotis]
MQLLKQGEARSWGLCCDEHGKVPDRKKEARLAEQCWWRDKGLSSVISVVRSHMGIWTPLR